MSVVLAIAITAIGALLAFAHRPDEPAPERIVATTIVLEKALPTPRPAPTATPTPPPLVRATFAPVPQRAAPQADHTAGAGSIALPPVPHPVHPRVVIGRASGSSAGNGSGTGAGMGDDAGAGNGTGGSGTGAIDADAPCGYVEFVPTDPPKIVGDVASETISAMVHYPDGHTESEELPYPWVYSDWMDTDPWSPINIRRVPKPTVFAQLPPPGSDTSRYNEVVRYILDHTNPNGSTVLQPCPARP